MSKCLGSLIFIIIPEEIVYCLFNFLFDILWNRIYLNYAPKFEQEDLVHNYFFTSQIDSHSVPDINFFCETFTYILPIGVIERRIYKSSTIILMGYFDLAICPDLSVLLLYAPAYRAWIFKSFIFELKVFSYSFEITCILLRQVITPKKMVMSSAKFTNLIHGLLLVLPWSSYQHQWNWQVLQLPWYTTPMRVGIPGVPLA